MTKMKTPPLCLWMFLLAAALACVNAPAAESTPRDPGAKPRSIMRLANGRDALSDELKVTLKEAPARRFSRDAGNRARLVDRAVLKDLHPDILRIEARHTGAKRWLAGERLPNHLEQADGGIPRIARRFNVVLQPGADAAAVRNALLQHPSVERVDFKEVASLEAVPNDTDYGRQWAPPITGLVDAWDVAPRGRVRVAVIDSGVRLSHPEFAGRIVFHDGYADFSSGDAPTSGSGFDHGTHVAGIVCAARNNSQGVAGYANEIDLMVLNCATWNAASNRWQVLNADDAIDDAVANGARVINCSFGFGSSIQDEVDDAFAANVLVVHSAGNESTSIAGSWESGSASLLTITALTTNGAPATDVFDTSYSNFGPGVDLAAPGTAIWSTVPGGYGFKLGTSMAAPQVSGAAALLMSMNPGLIEDHSARDLLVRMAQDKGPPGYDQQYGWGVLRLRRDVLQVCRNATAFVSPVDNTGGDNGHYDEPWPSIPVALANVPNNATLVLNGGDTYTPVYRYPAITISKPCTLNAIPDRPVLIGQP
jgi:subtilisin family serine protease